MVAEEYFVTFCSVPWGNTGHVVEFASRIEQEQYFASLPSVTLTDSIPQTKSGKFTVQAYVPDLDSLYNYIYFTPCQDLSKPRHIYYAFVDSINYLGEDVVSVTYSEDVWQNTHTRGLLTWGQCYIDRAHVRRKKSDGSPDFSFCSTPENIDIGTLQAKETVAEIQSVNYEPNSDYHRLGFIILVTLEGYYNEQHTGGYSLTRVPFNVNNYHIYILPVAYDTSSNQFYRVGLLSDGRVQEVQGGQYFSNFAENPKTVAAYYTETLPYDFNFFYDSSSSKYLLSGSVPFVTIPATPYPIMTAGGAIKAEITETYTQIYDAELKLSCYPYTYYQIYRGRLAGAIYQPQYLGRDYTVHYVADYSTSEKSAYYMTPYTQLTDETASANMQQSELPLRTDYYKQFVLQNKASTVAGVAKAGISAGASVITGALSGNLSSVVGGLTGGINSLLSVNGKIQDLQNTPDSVKSPGNHAAIEYILNSYRPKLVKTTLASDALARVRAFFGRYGYTTATVGLPSVFFKTRKYFNYIKTTGCTLIGNLSNDRKKYLQDLFDSGVTVWHYIKGDFRFMDFQRNNPDTPS